MEPIPIKDAIRSALKKGNWLAYNQLATVQDNEFYFFQFKGDAKECCLNNSSDLDRWDVTYIRNPEKFIKAVKKTKKQSITYS